MSLPPLESAESAESVSPGVSSSHRRWLAAIGTVCLLILGGIGLWWLGQNPDTVKRQKAATEPSAENQTDTTKVELDPAKQKEIWNAEHVTFEIETYVGKPLAAALKDRKADRLKQFFRPGFRAAILKAGQAEVIDHPPLRQERRRAEQTGTRTVDADRFVQSLLKSLSSFSQIERTRLRVLTINRDEQNPPRWHSKFLLTVDGLGPQKNPLHWESEQQVEYHFADDAEIQRGQVLDHWKMETVTLRSSSRFLMEETTVAAKLSELPIRDNWKSSRTKARQYNHQIAVEDFNRDGFPDIAVGTYDGHPLLLKNVGGKHFEDVTAALGIKGWRMNLDGLTALAGWIDYDNDGFPDLILGRRLYHNVAGEKFVDVTADSGLKIGFDPMGCTVADYDGDGRLDLYILYQNSASTAPGKLLRQEPEPWIGDSHSGAENALWHNEGDGRFRDVTVEAGAGGGQRHSFAAVWLYFDEDHHPDLYIANDFGHNVLLRNLGDGTFEDISETTGTSDFATSMGVCAADLNNDGSPELYVANMYSKMGRRIIGQVSAADYPPGVLEQIQGSCTGNRLYTKRPGESRYREISEKVGVNAVGWAYAPSAVDLDGDGLLDLYASTGFMSFDRHKPDG